MYAPMSQNTWSATSIDSFLGDINKHCFPFRLYWLQYLLKRMVRFRLFRWIWPTFVYFSFICCRKKQIPSLRTVLEKIRETELDTVLKSFLNLAFHWTYRLYSIWFFWRVFALCPLATRLPLLVPRLLSYL